MNGQAETKLPGLEGRRVAITAGAGGIGLEIARFLRSQGARLAICDVDQDALSREGEALGAEVAMIADVSDEGQVAAFFSEIRERLGGLDALVNNAGIAGPTGRVDAISVSEWRACVDINLMGQFLCAHHAVPLLLESGGGSIIGMSSAAGRFGYAFRTPYAAAKWGIIGFTQSLAKELGPEGIRANAILPGIIEGPRMEGVIAARARETGVSHEEMKETYLSRVSLRRMTPQADVAYMAGFLISDLGANLSGQSFPVDGNVEAL